MYQSGLKPYCKIVFENNLLKTERAGRKMRKTTHLHAGLVGVLPKSSRQNCETAVWCNFFLFFSFFLDTLRVLLDWIFIRSSSRGTSDERFVVLMAVDEETFYVYNWYNMWGARQHGKIPLSLRNRQTLCSGGPLGRECLGCFWKKLKIKGGCLGERMLDVSFSEKIKNHGGALRRCIFVWRVRSEVY